jgi:hypothetical protein
MGRRSSRVLLAGALLAALGGCSGGGSQTPAAVGFTRVDLPAGAVPEALAADGDALLIGIRRDAAAVKPGVLRRAADGGTTELAIHGATPYGLEAHWFSLDSDGTNIVGLGGERGGAHGNERWSGWTGTVPAGLTEKMQAFSTFGGYGAGELLDAVQTTAGPSLVGTWASARAGLDVMVWTFDGTDWKKVNPAGSVLESTPAELEFPVAAASSGAGIVITGWELSGGEKPVVWRSSSLATGWTRTPLPDAGKAGGGLAVACPGSGCVVAGRVDGKLALWRQTGSDWKRLAGVPGISVGDKDKLAAPVDVDGQLVEIAADGGQVTIARADGDRWTTRPAGGPTGMVTALTRVGKEIYLLAGPDLEHLTLWRAEAGAVNR